MANAYRPSRVCSSSIAPASAQTTSSHKTNGTPNRAPSPRNENDCGMRCTGRPLEMISVMPRIMPSVPSVTMNGLIFSRVVRKPLASPQARPVSTPTATPAGMAAPRSMAMVPISPPMARMAPTERSMPPAMITSVMPSAMMLITAVCRTTLDRFVWSGSAAMAMRQADEQNDEREKRQQPLYHSTCSSTRDVVQRRVAHDLFLRGARPATRAVMRPCRITRIRSATCSNSDNLGTHHQNGRARARQLVHHLEDLHLRAHVDAARRLVEQEHARVAEQPFGDDDFLLIAAAQPAGQLPGRIARIRSRAMNVRRPPGSPPRDREIPQRLTVSSSAMRHVVADGAAPWPGRASAGPRESARCRRAPPRAANRIAHRLPIHQDASRSRCGSRPNSARHSSVRPAPTSPARPTISPARSVKLDVLQQRRAASSARTRSSSAPGVSGFALVDRGHLAAHHVVDDAVGGERRPARRCARFRRRAEW